MPTHEMMVERCEKLVPALAERAADGERLRRLPEETIRDAAAADLFRTVLPPTTAGGHGLGLRTLGQMTRVLSHGDSSAGWTLSFLVLHNWFLYKFGPRMREELFADGEPVLAPAPLAPTGRAVTVDGGYRVTGRWEWATGVMHADWVMVHAIAQLDGAPEPRYCLLPASEVRVEDVWHMSGMRGTGSNTVVLDDVLVPEHRTVPSSVLRAAPAGTTGSPEELFPGYPTVPVLALVSSAVALGSAERVVELFTERMTRRVLAYSAGDRQADQPQAQSRLAAALATVRGARAGWEAALDAVDAANASPAGMQPHDRAAARLTAAHTVRLSRQVISQIGEGAGASVYAESSPLQRFQRDIEVLKGHAIFDWDRTTELAGRIELGGAPRPTDML